MIETSINSADLSWEQAENYPAGTMRKTLRKDSSGNPLTMLLKLPPGYAMDEHSHIIAEHHYLLEGEYEVKGEVYRAGHYNLIPGHTTHGPFRSGPGAMLLVIWES